MRESKVEDRLRHLVIATGGFCRKARWIGHRGAPDRWCGWPGQRAAWVETKKPSTPHAEAHQKREHERMRSCGEQVEVLATIEAVTLFVHRMTGIPVGQLHLL